MLNTSDNDTITDNKTRDSINEQHVADLLGLISGFVEKLHDDDLYKKLVILQNLLQKNRFSIGNAMERLMYQCENLLVRCRWAGEIVDCNSIFSTTETTFGYCCGFNLIPGTR